MIREPARILSGLPYSLTLMAILGVHEPGHYFSARRHGIRVTPLLHSGAHGIRDVRRLHPDAIATENRRALFDVAGAPAGLAVAVPTLLVGLRASSIVSGDVPAVPAMPMMGGTSVGSSVLFALLAKRSIGPSLEYGHMLRLSPLAFAGWLGLLVTALNLLPIGRLDGSHIAHAMLGFRIGNVVSTVAMWRLVLLAIFVWPGLTMWATAIFFIADRAVPPLNDLAPVTPGRR